MKEMLRYGLTLALICMIASGLLAGVNSLTQARIIAQAQIEEQEGLEEIIPLGEHFEPVKSDSGILYYKAYDKDKKLIAFAFKAQGKGYSSTIETLVGMKKDGSITAIKVLSQNETPGLGVKITEPAFTAQFADKFATNLEGVQAITGATISSRAVIDSVQKKAEEIKALIKDEK